MTRSGATAVTVVDYGLGNLGSIFNMLRYLDVRTTRAETAQEVRDAEKLLLPGVGSFDRAMSNIGERDLAQSLKDKAAAGAPILGICLGMQILTGSSTEGLLPGLGIIDGRCERFELDAESTLRVPHMGWNYVEPVKQSPLFEPHQALPKFYFAHSYHVICDNPSDVLATTSHGETFVSMFSRDGIIGAQFHPEKSHTYGLSLLARFAEMDAS